MKCDRCSYDDNGTGDFAHACGPVNLKVQAQPKREWVGLIAADMDEITDDAISVVDAMLLTETKLKELNK